MLKTKKRLILLIISILAIILSGFLGIKVSAKYIFNTPDYHIGDISYTASDTQLNVNYVENYTSNVIKTKSSYKVRNNKKNKEAIKVFFNDNSKTSLSLNGVTITKPKTIGNYDFFKIDTVSDPYNITIRYKEKTTKTLQYLDNFTNEVLKTETLNVYTGDDYNITPTKIEHYDFNKSDKALTGKNAKNDTIKIYEEIKYSMFDFNPDANKYGYNYSQGARIKSFDAEVFYKNGTSIKKYTGISDYFTGEGNNQQKIPYQGWIIFSNITYREGYEYQSTYFANYGEDTILENNPNGKFSNVSSNGFKMIQINDGNNKIIITTSPIKYNIKYNLNGGSVTGNPTTYTVETADFTLKNPTRTGYTFTGWSGSATGTTVKIAKGSTGDKSFTANFKANTYKVKFDGNGATSGTMPDLDMTYDTPKNVTTNTFTKTGYTFDGWNTAKDGTGKDYGNSQSINNLTTKNGDSITFYAKWKANSYTIKFDGNGATSGTTANLVIKYDETKPLTDNGFQKTGYTFDGWNTKADGTGTNYTDKQSVKNLTATDGETVTLYAKWNIINYSITYNLNGGTDAKNPATYNINTADITLKNPTRTGYTFTGWSGSATGTTVKIAKGSTGDKSFTANFKANTYTVKFNGNGATSGTTANLVIKYDETKPLTDNGFQKTGYTFDGWNTKADGTGTNYTEKQSVKNLTATDGETVTLYAKWTAQKLNIIFNKNDGSGQKNTQSLVYDGNMDDNNLSPTSTFNTRTGYTFKGWSFKSDGSDNTNYPFNDKIGEDWFLNQVKNNKETTINLYGQWTINKYRLNINVLLPNGTETYTTGEAGTIQLSLDGGKTYTGDIYNETTNCGSVNYNTDIRIRSIKPGAGMHFGSITGTGTIKDLGNGIYQMIMPASASEINVKMAYNNYTLTVNANGGTWSGTTPQTIASRSTVSIANPTRTGYTFAGWTVTGTGASITDGTFKMGSSNATLTAKWNANTYTVKFNGNGATSGTTANQTLTYDKASNLNANGFVRTGYNFAGWNTKADGTGTNYSNKQEVKNLATTGTVNLYAKWNIINYSITYNLNGGTDPKNPATYNINTADITLKNPTRTGYTFTGWSGSATGTTVKIAKGSTGNKSFTANWKKNEEIYNITYNLGGGKNNASNPSTYKTTDNTITIQDPTRTGYTFLGWSGSNSLTGTSLSQYTTSNPYTAKGRDHILGNDFSVTPGKTYRVFVTAKRLSGNLDMQGGIWYTAQTQGASYDGYGGIFTKIKDLGNGYAVYYKDVTVKDGKTKGKFYIQLDQDTSGGSTSWRLYDMHVIKVEKPTIPKGSQGNKSFTANWKEVPKYVVDVNPVIQNEQCNSGKDGFTFDVYENGVKVSKNVIDYYSNNVPKGTAIRVVVHPRTGYNIRNWTDQTFIVNENMEIKPTWYDDIAPTTDNGGFFRVTECHRYWWVSKNMWATNGASDYRVVAYVYDGGTGIDFSGGSGGMYMNSTANQYWHKMGDSFTYSSSIGNGISHSPMFAKNCGNGWFKFWTVFTCTGPNKTVTFKMDIKDRAGNNRHLEFNYNTWWSPTDENIGTEGSIRSERGNDGCGAKFNPWSEEEDEEENNIEFFAKNTNITLENETKEENTISENIIKNENTNTLENTTSSKNITLEEKDNKVKENNTSKDNKVNEESINSSKAKVNNFEASENLVSDDKSSEKENK